MASKKFEVGDLVWAKMKGFAPWPAQIKEPPNDCGTPSKIKQQNYVYFFGSKNFAWILKNNITPHSNKMVQAANLKKKSQQLQSAIDEILRLNEKMPKRAKAQSEESDSQANTSKTISSNKKRVANEKAVPKKKRQRKMKESPKKHIDELDSDCEESICSEEQVKNLNNESDQQNEISSRSQSRTPRRRKPLNIKSQPRPIDANSNCLVPPNLPQLPDDSYANFLQKYQDMKQEHFRYTLHSYFKRNPLPISPRPPVYITKPTETLDILTVCDYVKEKEVVATKKKIGFIGLGTIGQGIVKSLLNTGHDVTLWNRTAERCKPFLAAGARRASTPKDVVSASDIIFSCLKDQEAVKSVVFYKEGIMMGFGCSSEPGKIYAEMTLINKQAAENVREHIEELGGKYLEAGFYGTKEMAENGKLVLTVAGDLDAYKECESCFKAMSETSEYTGRNLGNVCNIAIHSFEGKLTAIVAEIMYIAQKVNIPQIDLFKILEFSPYYCELIKDAGKAILSQDYSPKVSVSRTLNAMKLVSESNFSTTSNLGSAIRRLYAKAEDFNYGSHDMSAAYLMYGLPRNIRSEQDVQSEPDVLTSTNQL